MELHVTKTPIIRLHVSVMKDMLDETVSYAVLDINRAQLSPMTVDPQVITSFENG